MATANGVIKTFSPKQILDNLNVLGGFDKLPNLNQNYMAKLNIEPNGNFVMVDGKWAAWRRNSDSSLLADHNTVTISNLFKLAIETMKIRGDRQNPGLRKAIFDGLRGYTWLIVNGYLWKNKDKSTDCLKNILTIRGELGKAIRAAINTMKNFHSWYDESQPQMMYRNFGQEVYLTDSGLVDNGICFGISTKWLLRWAMDNKNSILDSSKPTSPDQLNYNLRLDQAAANFKSINPTKWLGMQAVYRDQAEFQLREMMKQKMQNRNIVDPRAQSIEKKGAEMYVTMHQQSEIVGGGDLKNVVQNASINLTQELSTAQQKLATATQQQAASSNPRRYQKKVDGYQEDVDYLQKKVTGLNTVAAMPLADGGGARFQDANAYLNYVSKKYQGAASGALNEMELPSVFYLRDSTDFAPHVRNLFLPLVQQSIAAANGNQRIGFMITWRAGQCDGYLLKNGAQSGGHALGFHRTDTGSFIAFDPNYGEFSCADENELVNHFARWFSLYSRDTAIKNIGSMKIENNDQSMHGFMSAFTL